MGRSNIFVFLHSLCRFNNPLAFKNVDEHIDNIEKFVRENHTQIPELTSTEFKLQIFGPITAAKFNTFHFQDGDRFCTSKKNLVFTVFSMNLAKFHCNTRKIFTERQFSNKKLLFVS